MRYVYDDAALSGIETMLSPERFATYLTATCNDREAAARLYTWNTAVSGAFYGPLQSLEVAVRNSMHLHLSAEYGPEWYDGAHAGLDANARTKITQLKAELRRSNYPVDTPHVVAGLSFGFWVSLLGRGGYSDASRLRRASYEMTLWRPALRKAFPHAVSLNRVGAHTPLDYLRTFRNRIAHHEPIFSRHLQRDYDRILEVIGWICPQTKAWTEAHSRVPEVLGMARDSIALRF